MTFKLLLLTEMAWIEAAAAATTNFVSWSYNNPK
jgi:hypothetical protein